MHKTFQKNIDEALKYINVHGVETEVHFVPVEEEAHRKRVLKLLSKRLPQHSANRVHIGVAGGFNFSIAAQTRPDRILLLDINKNQERFWRDIIAALAESEDSLEFMNKIDVVCASHSFRKYDSNEESFYYLVEWMNEKDGNYQYLHRMAKEGNIATATLDISKDKEAAEAIAQVLNNNNLTVDTCYWSNIASFMQPHDRLGQYVSTEHGVNGPHGKLIYPNQDYFSVCKNSERMNEPGQFEQLMQLCSVLGNNEHTCHIFTGGDENFPLLMTDGPPRHLARIAARHAIADAGIVLSSKPKRWPLQ